MKKGDNTQTKEFNVDTGKDSVRKMKRSRTTSEALQQRVLSPKKPLAKQKKPGQRGSTRLTFSHHRVEKGR